MKNIIKNSFSNAANTYDRAAIIQEKTSENLVNLLNKNILNKDLFSVLDIGCGTGITSIKLIEKMNTIENITLLDLSKSMIEKAMKKKLLNKTKYIIGDAEQLLFDTYYQIAISNLSAQWFLNLEKFIEKTEYFCNIFAFSTLLHGTFQKYKELFLDNNLTSPTFEYLKANDVLKICNTKSRLIDYEIKSYAITFDSMISVAKYFKMLGVNINSSKDNDQKNNLLALRTYTNEITLNYEVFFGIIQNK